MGKRFQGKHLIPILCPKLLLPSTCRGWDGGWDDVGLPTLRSSYLESKMHSGLFISAVTCLERNVHFRNDETNCSIGIKGGKHPKVISAAVPVES